MSKLFIKPEHLQMLLDVFNSYCPEAEIWVYGSRINGTAHEGSDIDIVVKDFHSDDKYLYELKELLNDSDIPFLMDIHEFKYLPESFQKEILKDYVVLK